MQTNTHKLNTDVYIITLGTFPQGTEVVKLSQSDFCKVRTGKDCFFVDSSKLEVL